MVSDQAESSERGREATPAGGLQEAARQPVETAVTTEPERLEPWTALCLSGGGYRAMLFHAGALWRLNELGYLPRLDRVSSVSGGSITAGVLGMNWGQLVFDDGVASNFAAQVVAPVRRLAGTTIDEGSILRGVLLPGSVADRATGAYRKHVFGDTTLQDLPERPRFIINATNVQTGALWRFSRRHMADYKVGLIPEPTEDLAVAVAASAAFPPVLSPLELELDPSRFAAEGRGALHRPPFTTQAVLTDGGVYDNVGLETAWKRCETVLVSDGGGRMGPDPEPKRDWARHALRINSVIDNQVRNLRKRQVIAGFDRGDRRGTYWGIRSHVADYGPPAGSLPAPPGSTLVLAETKTRLKKLDDRRQEMLINWGYAMCDVAMRRWVVTDAPAPEGFPYPAAGVG